MTEGPTKRHHVHLTQMDITLALLKLNVQVGDQSPTYISSPHSFSKDICLYIFLVPRSEKDPQGRL